MLNRIISIRKQYVKPFNCVQTINSNTWNYLIECKQMIDDEVFLISLA